MAIITAPFTAEQVEKLNRWQHNDSVHPFTCPNRRDEHHGDKEGILVADSQGWFCLHCKYQQNWAHDFMLKIPDSTRSKLVD